MIYKGYATECLLLGGAYCATVNLVLGIVLICIGCVAAAARYGQHLSATSKKEKLYDAASKFITKIVENPAPTVDLSSFVTSEEVH